MRTWVSVPAIGRRPPQFFRRRSSRSDLPQAYRSPVPIAIYLAGAAAITLIALAFARESKGIDPASVDAAAACCRESAASWRTRR